MACSTVNFIFFVLKLTGRKFLRNLRVEWRIKLKFILKRQNIRYWLDSSVLEQVRWCAAARKVINFKSSTKCREELDQLSLWLRTGHKKKTLRTNVTTSFRWPLNDKKFKKPCVNVVAIYQFSSNRGALSQCTFLNVHTNWKIIEVQHHR